MPRSVRLPSTDATGPVASAGLRFRTVITIVLLASRPLPAAGPPELAGLDALYPSLDALYIDLHKNPELSLQE